ncbi:hypothetical protein H4R21_005346 [Coemansia helicoidea]|uniref:Uncharacterized protein n=1 Tax=Coemansia helicoidea TaxID=1286919 RepID=A0ACC1KU88_9FUNG|nr:hypothetical protein H4R21_005346 [Coemansia helicoidea]
MLSPEVLVGRGVDVVTCDQRAGEFIVTFPQSYHAGFNQGLNFNEAVNFATPDWMPYGVSSVDRYRQYARHPVFSHDELLMTMHDAGPVYQTQAWFRAALVDMLRGELAERLRVRALWPAGADALREAPWNEFEPPDADVPEDARQQCLVCRAFSYLSAVVCDCSSNYVTCLRHAEKVRGLFSCRCAATARTCFGVELTCVLCVLCVLRHPPSSSPPFFVR